MKLGASQANYQPEVIASPGFVRDIALQRVLGTEWSPQHEAVEVEASITVRTRIHRAELRDAALIVAAAHDTETSRGLGMVLSVNRIIATVPDGTTAEIT